MPVEALAPAVNDVVDQQPSRHRGSAAPIRRWLVAARRSPSQPVSLITSAAQPANEYVLDALKARGLSWGVARLDKGERLPDVNFQRVAIVSAAGPIEQERIDWMRDADGAGVPVLALGSAAHELLVALGGSFSADARARHAWINVTTRDPRTVAPGPWLTWGARALNLPSYALELARDHSGPQAFAVGRHLGIQLHPYASAKTIRELSSRDGVVIDTQGLLEGASRDRTASLQAAERLLGGFLNRAL